MKLVWVIIPLILFGMIGMQDSFAEEYQSVASPKHQLESGVASEDIICKENRFLVIRSNGQPACVTEKTADKMNWEIIKTIPKSTPLELEHTLKTSVDTEITSEEKSIGINLVLTREIIYGYEGISFNVITTSNDALYYDIVDSDNKTIWPYSELRMSDYGRGFGAMSTNILSPGEYTITAYNENIKTKKNFTVMDSKCCRPLSVSIDLDGGVYLPGEEFQIYVKSKPDALLTFSLIDPDGKIAKIKHVTSNKKGVINFESFTLSRIATLGTWVLEVTDQKNSDSIPITVIPIPDELVIKSPTTQEILTSYDEKLAKINDGYNILLASSLEPFEDDGREKQKAILHRGGPPQLLYPVIIESYKAGFDVDDKGIVTYVTTPHEKYSLNPGKGFYLEDWLPEQIPDGQKLLYATTGYSTNEINGNTYESYSAIYYFVPNSFVLHENVTQYDVRYDGGFYISVGYSDLQDSIDDVIEESKDLFAQRSQGYGGYQEMLRDGKHVLAFNGGHQYDHENARIFWIFDDKFSMTLHSYYYDLEELIPIFERVMQN